MARFKRNVFCNDEYCDTRPDKVTIDIDEKLARRILRLNKAVIRLGVYQIQEFNYTPDFREAGVKVPDWRLDCVILEVSDCIFRWTALIKHTSIEVFIDGISITELLKKFPQLKG